MEELDLKELLALFGKKKWIILLIVLIITAIGLVYSFYFIEPKYESSTTLILGRINASSENGDVLNDGEEITQSEISINSNLVATYSELIKSKTLIQKVIDNLGLDLSEQAVRNSITVSRISETELIEIKVRNSDMNLASEIANEIAVVFSEKIEEIYNISNVYIIDRAVPAEAPYNINHIKDIGISITIAVIISIGYILIIHLLDNTIKNENEIEKVIGLKNLINIPLEKGKGKKESQNELITYQDSKSIVSEAFRTLRTNVQFSNANAKEGKTFLVSSCFPSEGKSYVSANLAITFAQIGKKVILVDADMRRGRQSKVFKIPNCIGLSNYISNLDENGLEINYELNKFIHETSISNLNLITAGTVPPNPAELLASGKFSDLIEELKKYYDIIIFDGAPIIPITDSLILARMLESTILVALYNKTKKEDLLKVKNDIEAVGGKIIGTCINCVPVSSSKKNSRYYYYKEDSEVNKKKKVKIRDIFLKFYSLIVLKIKKFINKIKELTGKNKIPRLPASKPKMVSIEIKAKNSNFDKPLEIVKQKEKDFKEISQKQLNNQKLDTKSEEVEILNKKALKEKRLEEKEKQLKQKEEEKKKQDELEQKEKQENLEQIQKEEVEKEQKRKEKIENKKKILKEGLSKVKNKITQNFEKIEEKFKVFYKKSKENYDIFLEKQAKKKIENEEKKEKLLEEKKIQKEELKKIREVHLEEQKKMKEEKQEKLKLEKEEQRKQKEVEQEKLKQEREEQRKQKEIEQEKLKLEREEEKAKEKEEAKLTDEYIEENLYPKTKNTKLF